MRSPRVVLRARTRHLGPEIRCCHLWLKSSFKRGGWLETKWPSDPVILGCNGDYQEMSVPQGAATPAELRVLQLRVRWSGRNWFPVVCQKLGNAVNRISGNSGKHVFEPGERQWECIAARGKLHTLPLTGCVEAAQDGCCLATPVTTEELAARRQRQSRSKGRRDPLNRGILPTAWSPAEGVFARDLARPRRSQALRDRSTHAQPLGIGPNLIRGFAVRLPENQTAVRVRADEWFCAPGIWTRDPVVVSFGWRKSARF